MFQSQTTKRNPEQTARAAFAACGVAWWLLACSSSTSTTSERDDSGAAGLGHSGGATATSGGRAGTTTLIAAGAPHQSLAGASAGSAGMSVTYVEGGAASAASGGVGASAGAMPIATGGAAAGGTATTSYGGSSGAAGRSDTGGASVGTGGDAAGGSDPIGHGGVDGVAGGNAGSHSAGASAVSSCDLPPNPVNGSVATTGTAHGSTATYVCAKGYRASGLVTRTCQIGDTWSGTTPTCSLVDCGALTNPLNGQVSAPLTIYGSTGSYSCLDGFALSGVPSRTCQADGNWSDAAPSCSRRKQYVLSVGADANGLAVPSGTLVVQQGLGVQLNTVPNPGFAFGAWQVSSGSAVLGDASHSSTTATLQNGNASVVGSFSALSPAQSLLACYPFEGNSNNACGTSRNGTVNGAVLGPGQGLCGTSGYRFKWATSDSITLDNTVAMQFSSAMTIEAWVYPEAWDSTAAHYYRIASRYPTFLLRAEQDGYPVFGIDRSGAPGTYPGVSSTEKLPMLAWSYLVGTFDGKDVKLYVNGALKATYSLPTTDTIRDNVAPIRIGDNSLGEGFTGVIDNVGIFDRARTAAEIKVTYDTIAACLAQN